MTAQPHGASLLAVRTEWQRVRRQARPATLRVGLLASYTVDPLVPYLGMGLHEGGLPAEFTVGPFDQIMRQCLDEDGEIARLRPDVLLVLPRFEELGADAQAWPAHLLDLADAALAATARWGACLVFVLPAVPQARPFGVGDAGQPDGVVAAATRAREGVRAQLGARPNVCLADTEETLRSVGADRAHHPTMFRYAKVPYTEELFAGLGRQLARVLGQRYGHRWRAAVVDADSLLLSAGDGDAERRAAADALRSPLLQLHRAGVRLGLRGSRDADRVWDSLAIGFPEFGRDLVDGCVVDGRPLADQLDAIAADTGVAVDETVLLTANPEAAHQCVVLGDRPESWLSDLLAAGLFDQPAPPAFQPADPVPTGPVPAASQPAAPEPAGPEPAALADFVASLAVSVTFLPARPGHLDKVAEVVERAKDFTLGIRHSAAAIADRADEITAVVVRDRFGDYGVSGAVALRPDAGVCTVDLFSLSCPVLGKDVETAVLREVVLRASRAGCTTVVFRYHRTAHNESAVRFLTDAATRAWPGDGGRQVRIHALPADEPLDLPALAGGSPAAPVVEPAVPFGIVAFGSVLAEPVDVGAAAPRYTADLERVQSWEYRRFHRADDATGITDLAVEAGRRALAAADLDATDIDLVVLAISDIAEYLYWDPAAATQARLGARRAEALLLTQACGGGVAAFDVVAGKFATHPGYRNALIIGANRVCEPYWNRMEINTSIYSDGAAAAVVRRDHGTCRWLTTEFITDGAYADFMRMDIGGAARPFVPGDPAPVRVNSPFDRLDDFFDGDVRRMFEFVATIRRRNREVIEAACARAGVAPGDIRRVLHFNDNAKQLAELAGDLGIPLEQTNHSVAMEHAHLGCADQLLSLQRQLAAGELVSGDLVALTSNSSGMHWICTLLRV